jgi:hypothetical protein
MSAATLQSELSKPSANIDAIAKRIARHPQALPEVFDGLHADKAKVKYGCLKLLRRISEKAPAVVYPETDRLIALLDSENNILQWGAIIVLGNLAAVDSQNRIEKILDRYLQPISGPVLVTAANVMGGAAKIARAKPHLADRIAHSLLQVETANYRTAECRNVALGKAVESLDLFFDCIQKQQPVVEFVERRLKNRRNAVKQKALAFLKRHAPDTK